MYNCSIILLFRDDLNHRKIIQLRATLARNFLGRSALALPVHITLLKWKDKNNSLNAIKRKWHYKEFNESIFVENIEASNDQSSVWYPIRHSVVINSEIHSLKSKLFDIGLLEEDILVPNPFHITLAYKDFSIDTIHKIRRYIERLNSPNHFYLYLKYTVLSICSADGIWSIVNPL